MRRLRTWFIAAGTCGGLLAGGILVFGLLDERRNPAPAPQGVVIGQPTCLAPAVLSSLIPVPVLSPEPSVDPLPPPGTIPNDFHPTSAVVCEFMEYTADHGYAVVRQTSRIGNLTAVVEELDRPSAKRPWFGECPTAATIPTPVVWLVNAEGNAVRVAFPVDGMCGNPLPDAYRAIMNLTVQDEQIHKLPRSS
ncbi:hypothetical protein FFI94_009860 [Rhodococcus sp. KBS0724]|nr:hypothetical protein FFI94_009860 [Rhodococcus sp. KBS0724]